jgi:hypothetical protein
MLLRPILVDARTGTLDPNWRQGLSAGMVGGALETSLEDSNQLAVHSLSIMDVQPWEPYTGSGWRTALEAWYAALQEAHDSRDRTDRSVPGSEADAPEAVVRFSETIARNPVLTDFAERAAEGRRRWRDSECAWYYAGLAAGGLEVDWRGWYRSRIAAWTNGLSSLEGPSAIEELTALEHGDKDHMQSLPAYWT